MGRIWKVLTRKKVYDDDTIQSSQLPRVLNTFDLTSLGVGSTLGVGVYVIVGHVARDTAGPAVVLSFLIAAIASVFAGLCYAEFGARTPRAGSAYVYSYTCIGEFVAFIIGWNLILEYVIGSASVAKGLSVYIDTLANDTLKSTFMDIAPMNVQYMAEYFDFFSFGIALLLAVGLAFGMKESSIVNNIFTTTNIIVVLFVIIAGSITADPNNWRLEADVDSGAGDGGFFPFGVEGMIRGAATCFYAFIGFDCIATTGEEVKNPRRAIPIAIVISLLISFLCYFSTATVVTMMVPFYAQDIHAPLPHAFAEVGWEWAKWVVAFGGIFGLFASLFGAMFPLPRILYAMASDGLIFRFLGIISSRFSAPVIGTLIAGVLTGLMSALFDLAQLVNMMSIGTLLAYTIVAACVLLLRRFEADEHVEYTLLMSVYSDSDDEPYTDSPRFEAAADDINIGSKNINELNRAPHSSILKNIFGCGLPERPTKRTERLATVFITLYSLLALIFGLFFMFMHTDLANGELYAIVLTSVVGFLLIATLLLLALQPTTSRKLTFKVPFVPFVPALSILINIYLMLMLDVQTWIRFGIWMLIGVPMYITLRLCCPSKHSSSETSKNIVNGSIVSNGPSEFQTDQIKSIGDHRNGDITRSSVLPEDYSQDSGFGSTVALYEDLNVVDAAPVEIRSKKSLSSVDVVIAELDSVISQEETMQTALVQSSDRKLSVDTVSNASCLPVEEKVVALVHREDIISEPTTPAINPFAPVSALLVTDPFSHNKKNDADKMQSQEENENDVQMHEENVSAQHNPDTTKSNESEDVASAIVNTAYISSIENKDNDSDESQPISLEDLNSERNESDTDVIGDSVPVIPAPPPMMDFEAFKTVRIPRVSAEKRPDSVLLQGIDTKPKLSPIPRNATPEPISASPRSSVGEEADDNVVFGGQRYAIIAAQLERMLKSNQAPQKLTKPEQRELELPKQSETLKPVMSQIIGEIVRNSTIEGDSNLQDNGYVDYKPQSPSDIRGKLEDIFRQPSTMINTPIRPSVFSRQNIDQSRSNFKQNVKPQENTEIKKPKDGDKHVHKEKMNDIFKTIKLRKVDSFIEK